jgi:hypothetical protein
MPKFVIERQYLVENFEETCKQGISDDIGWDTQEMDCDGARKTTLTFIKEIPAGLEESGAYCGTGQKTPIGR